MKKVISLILIVAMTMIPLCSCGAKSAENNGAMMDGQGGGPNDFFYAGQDTYGQFIGENDAMDGISESLTPSTPSEDESNTGYLENKFIKTSSENVSTFSSDVDTASYSYLRRLISQGYNLSELKATAGSYIRTEELINYFNYSYPSPTGDELFSTTMKIAPCPYNENAVLMMLGLKTKELEYSEKNNLVFLIDVSGSMNSNDKLGLLKKTFSHLTDKLGDDDVISIVTYSGKEEVVLDGCSGAKKDKILNAVNGLSAKGSTNGEAGLKKAYQLAEKHFIQGGNNRIIMASDGDLNVGISSVEDLKSFIEQKRDSGVFLSVLGYGTGNYKDAQMETIADCGNGVYYYIDSEIEAEKVFGSDIFSTLYTIAKDVKLQLTFNRDMIDAYRLVGYENRLLNKEDFENDRKDAGDLGAGHSLTVCYELILKDTAVSTDEDWMTLSVRYKAPDADKSEQNDYTFSRKHYTTAPDDSFKFVCSIIELSMLLHKSEYAQSIMLKDIKDDLAALKPDDEYKVQFKDLIDKLIKN